jgi:DNA-binding MarR family transcriptional regulator
MDFVARVEDDHDRRIRNLSLTPKGHAFYKKLLAINA